MGKEISEQGETKSRCPYCSDPDCKWQPKSELLALLGITRAEANAMMQGISTGFPILSATEPDDPQPFPNWQPVKCSDEFCGWRGPAAKSVSWGDGDSKRYCPKCWNKVVKHESNGGSPP